VRILVKNSTISIKLKGNSKYWKIELALAPKGLDDSPRGFHPVSTPGTGPPHHALKGRQVRMA
jgi:hypothetical protein